MAKKSQRRRRRNNKSRGRVVKGGDGEDADRIKIYNELFALINANKNGEKYKKITDKMKTIDKTEFRKYKTCRIDNPVAEFYIQDNVIWVKKSPDDDASQL